MPSTPQSPHAWHFFRVGGFDQVRLASGSDLEHLAHLDQKLWAALSVPVKGLAIDEQSLRLIDSDGDGHIRPPELLEALAWARARLVEPALLLESTDPLPLEAIDGAAHPALLSALHQILSLHGKDGSPRIGVADTCEAVSRFAAQPLNGDGIVCAASSTDPALAALIDELARAYASATDRSGQPGLGRAELERLTAELTALIAWHTQADEDPALARVEALAACTDPLALRDKIDDFFTRCELAGFDAQAGALLNADEQRYRSLADTALSRTSAALRALPLAHVCPEARLPLQQGLNPAWQPVLALLDEHLIGPVLGPRDALSASDWAQLRNLLERWQHWHAGQPAGALAGWPRARLQSVLDARLPARLGALIEADAALAGAADAMENADRIVRYARDLPRLLHNFVALRDFYLAREPAAFQAGTLFIDGRSCSLCLDVLDPVAHATQAGLSGLYLLYCDCRRTGEQRHIVAAVTAGDAEQLSVGRNGVFYDRQGGHWDARVTRIVSHPISVRQAFWSPYKRAARLIAEQLEKFAASRARQSETLADQAIAGGTHTAQGKAAQSFDIGRFAGIFAAIGLALGALGTALASLVTGLLGLPVWQLPLALAGLLALISGPSVALAWLKLRNRSLAALLDANGWAVNARARINLPFGTALTQLAQLPPGAERTAADPYAERKPPLLLYVLLGAALALLAFLR